MQVNDKQEKGLSPGRRRRRSERNNKSGFFKKTGSPDGKTDSGPSQVKEDGKEAAGREYKETADRDQEEAAGRDQAKDAGRDREKAAGRDQAKAAGRDRKEISKKRQGKSSGKDRKEKKPVPGIFSLLWSLLGVLALVAACLGTWQYMKEHNMVQRRTVTGGQADLEKLDVEPYPGTLLAKKSNSLDGVPFYSGPGSSEQTGLFPEGKCIQVTEFTELDGLRWVHASYCGLDGWLSDKYVLVLTREAIYIKPGTLVYVNAMTEKGIQGYARPDMASEVVRSGLLYGEEFTVEELDHGWGRVTDQGETFWINMYFMGSYPSEYWKVESLRSSEGINLRQEPDEHSKSLGKVPENQEVLVLEFHKGWGRVEYGGLSGWLKLSYMSPDKLPDQR